MASLTITKKAKKDLEQLGQTDAIRVAKKIALLDLPIPAGLDIKKMQVSISMCRLRVGTIRILFEVEMPTRSIIIRRVAQRRAIYKL